MKVFCFKKLNASFNILEENLKVNDHHMKTILLFNRYPTWLLYYMQYNTLLVELNQVIEIMEHYVNTLISGEHENSSSFNCENN